MSEPTSEKAITQATEAYVDILRRIVSLDTIYKVLFPPVDPEPYEETLKKEANAKIETCIEQIIAISEEINHELAKY